MVGLLGCGCCGEGCQCANPEYTTDYLEVFNERPIDWTYNATSPAVWEQVNGRLRHFVPPGTGKVRYFFGEAYKQFFRFQNLTGPPAKFVDPCFKKLTVSVDYETTDPFDAGPPVVTRRYGENTAALILTNLDVSSGSRIYFVRFFVTQQRTKRNYNVPPSISYMTSGVEYGYTEIINGFLNTQLIAKWNANTPAGGTNPAGNIKIVATYQGNANSTTVNPWLWQFFIDNDLRVQTTIINFGTANISAPGGGWHGGNCKYRVTTEATILQVDNDTPGPWTAQSTWFDNLLVSRSP